jgi:hypothetical protein
VVEEILKLEGQLQLRLLTDVRSTGDTYGSERICSPFAEETVNLGDWRVRAPAYVEAARPSSSASIEDFMMEAVDEVTA